MQLTPKDIADTRIITIGEDRIDAAIAISFKDHMRSLTDNAPDRIILDMTRVNFIDSSGLGAIVAAMKQASPERHLELAGLSSSVKKVFSLTRMDTVFTIHADLDAALGGNLKNAC